MKLNQKLYPIADGATPVEVQTFENRTIEVYLLDDFEQAKEEFVMTKGQFAVWSSIDGVNYRLFIEKGYREVMGGLYSAHVNEIWVNFWDEAEKINKNTNFKVLFPIVAIASILLISSYFIGEIGDTLSIVGLVSAIAAMIISNNVTRKKINNANNKSRDLIKEYLGAEEFDAIIERQRVYIEKYYDDLYPEDEEVDADDVEENVETEEAQDETEAEEVTEEKIEE